MFSEKDSLNLFTLVMKHSFICFATSFALQYNTLLTIIWFGVPDFFQFMKQLTVPHILLISSTFSSTLPFLNLYSSFSCYCSLYFENMHIASMLEPPLGMRIHFGCFVHTVLLSPSICLSLPLGLLSVW